MKKHLNLFLTMMKIGLFTFGGGYAMIALLENEFVEKKGWIDREEFLDMVAIAESTPGPIAINAATYIGYKNLGVWGSVVATLGVCTPSFAILFLISLFFDAFLSLTFVAYAFRGIRVAVVFLILSAGWKMLRKMKKTPFRIAVFTAVLGTSAAFSLFAVRFSTVFFILICGILGLSVYLVGLLRDRKEGGK